ncbi:putative 6-aminohexanoate-cyclic-dimer hydrolase [Caenibius tardaugens NBRC 16725]|uniref:Putative 6-aminohexanoate-cyclic-dimer hydrolase n=1 Tax=Caenibius tardaugens NBRC 16725 TaxID=1219035 RepID=U3A1A2_9SPHN|nr:amidase family protein [Caenibius tardaugens]AZI34991.1 amidase [Caenibius tardaugens NBRC 16725]GAD48543.1 putative 6-aminohexanoate-cyclic-dimer hydrolase [Caenibius tardaugens NBRC 16725]
MKTSRREMVAGTIAVAATVTAGGTVRAATSGSGHVLDTHDALGLAELVKTRQVSASELLESAIERAEKRNPQYNFMAHKLYERARAAVAKGVLEGPFQGVPWLIKDLNTNIEGELTEQGSRLFKGNRAKVSSELVKRYERAGLVIFGKTTSPEFGLTATTESKLMGDTRNPWNPAHSTGGSSGGSAAAVAAGVIPAAHATDGGGSIRIPASCCGLFGLKPSRGRVPMGPPYTEGWGGMSAHHAVTQTVRDSAALLDATHGLELGSRYTAPTPERPFLEEVGRDPGRLRIALNVTPALGTPVDPDVVAAVREAGRLCEKLGHVVEEAAPKLDMDAIGKASFSIIGSSIVANVNARCAALGIKPGPDVLEAATLVYYQMGQKATGADYAQAVNDLLIASTAVADFMTNYDILLSPVVASPPLPLGVISLSNPDIEAYFKAITAYVPFSGLMNQTGQPSMSVPLAMSKSGLPIGVMFSGRYGTEATLFRLAGQLETAAPWRNRKPRLPRV